MCIKYSHVSYIFLTISFCILHATQLQSSSILMVDTLVTRFALNLSFKVKRLQIGMPNKSVHKKWKIHQNWWTCKNACQSVSNLSLSNLAIGWLFVPIIIIISQKILWNGNYSIKTVIFSKRTIITVMFYFIEFWNSNTLVKN